MFRPWALIFLLLSAVAAWGAVTGSYTGSYSGVGGGGFGISGSITGGGPASGPPTITALSPASTFVGQLVTLTGTNFQGATGVTFGATAATFLYVNSTTINATVPSGTGAVNVHVTTPLGTSGSAAGNLFTYTAGCSNSMDFSQPCNTQYGF